MWQAKRGVAGIEEKRSGQAREVGQRVFLAIVYSRCLHEPVIRNPHAGDRLAGGAPDPRRLLQHDHAGTQFMGVQRRSESGDRSADDDDIGF